MEEVWKDINLASLNDQNTRPITTRSTFGAAILQDFLARPFNIDPPKNMVSSSSSTSISSECAVSLYSPTSPTPPPPPPPPPPSLVTALSLNSRPDFHFDPLKSSHLLIHPRYIPPKNVSSFDQIQNVAFTPSFPSFGNKRFAEPSDCSSVGDRRNKRMIKNRESAARSRARKQAYTNELEQKVQLLAEENARLKRQQQELWEASPGQQKKKSSLYRTSTAPF